MLIVIFFFMFQGERSSSVKPAYLDDLLFDPHATRTIFVGNLEKNLMHGELRSLFEKFGDVVVNIDFFIL